MQVGDLILFGRTIFRITGVYLGAVGVQNLIGLKSLSLRSGSAHGQRVAEMFVPEELVKGLDIYHPIERPRPTIQQLDQLLNSEDNECEITIHADGSVTAD